MKRILLLIVLCIFETNAIGQTSISETDKIAAWTKTWGFLKYFHPAVTHGTMDWDQIYLDELDSLGRIDYKEDLNLQFIDIIKKLNSEREMYVNPTETEFVDTIINNLYKADHFSDELIQYFKEIALQRISGKNRFLDFNEIDHPLFLEKDTYKDIHYPSKPIRLLALARIWATIEYFSPHKNRIELGWQNVLENQIPKFEKAKDSLEYYKAILNTFSHLRDSHSSITFHPDKYSPLGDKGFQLYFQLIEDKVVATNFLPQSKLLKQKDQIEYGDILISIDGISVDNLLNEYRQFVGGSHKASRDKFITSNHLRLGWNDTAVVEVERNSKIKKLILHRYKGNYISKLISDELVATSWKEIDKEIGFIRTDLMNNEEFYKAMRKLKKKKALVIDLRHGYNFDKLNSEVLAYYFSSEEKKYAHMYNISKDIPGKFYEINPVFMIGIKQKPKYNGKLIILIDEYVQSASETALSSIETFPNVTLIGQPTAGSNGNAALINLPGNYSVYFTAAGMSYPDGMSAVGDGIQPDIYVKRTIEGIKNNKDEILEKAIEYAKSN